MSKTLFWHRRDLRFHDNAGLFKALKENESVQSVFIFDKSILDKLPKDDQRVLFIHDAIEKLKKNYEKYGADLVVVYGNPVIEIPRLAIEFQAISVYTNRDYEPYAKARDTEVYEILKRENIDFIGSKDHVLFEKNEIVKADGLPYTIFTPYSRKWKEKMNELDYSFYPTEKFSDKLAKRPADKLISISKMGFQTKILHPTPDLSYSTQFMKKYSESRNFPAIKNGTSHLGVHLRFGTISIRELAQQAAAANETFLNELIWRDFYQAIIYHFPHSASASFKKKYDAIVWRNDEQEFKSWCEGKTGYPLVDAGMRELNTTGYMHNRVRMVVASFLTKHLLIDWKWGETYFAQKLLDYDLASNIGGWQWASGSGCDAAPYFRVFNPTAQLEKFDKQLVYVKKWVPEYGTDKYPAPIVEHKFARERVLTVYKEALNT
jgi:deoxyribodipyrimidine photo-lyase